MYRHGQLFVDAIEESRAALKMNGSEWVRMNSSIICGIIKRSKSGTEMNVLIDTYGTYVLRLFIKLSLPSGLTMLSILVVSSI